MVVRADFPAAVFILLCLPTAAHISSGTANTKGAIPPLSKSILENSLESVPFPLCSQLSDGVLKSKPSLSAGTLAEPYHPTVH